MPNADVVIYNVQFVRRDNTTTVQFAAKEVRFEDVRVGGRGAKGKRIHQRREEREKGARAERTQVLSHPARALDY